MLARCGCLNVMLAALMLVSVLAGLATAQSGSLDSGAWPTIAHDNQRTNRSSFQGPTVPGTPTLLYDAGAAINLNYITVTSDGKIFLSSCTPQIIALDLTGKPLGSPWPYMLLPTAYPGSPDTPEGGVTVSSSGTMYVATHECPDIPGGVPSHFYSIQGNGTTTPNWPVASRAMYWAPAIASSGTIFQMDEYNIINAYSPSGTLLWDQGLPSYGQGAIALDSADNLYVGTDSNLYGGHTVYSFTSAGTSRTGWPQDTGGITAPTTPVIGPDGGIFIANINGTLFGFNPDGSPRSGFPFVTGASTVLQRPLAISSSGTIYFKTTAGLYAVNPDGTPAWSLPFAPGGDATLSTSPVVDANGNIFVAFGNQVYSLNPNGTVRSGWPVTIANAGDMVLGGNGVLYVISAYQQLYSVGQASMGTISVTTDLSTATFTISGPTSFSGSGTSDTFENAPSGTYTIAFGAVAGYTTPAPQTQTLVTGGTITFSGNYTLVPPVSVSITLASSSGGTYNYAINMSCGPGPCVAVLQNQTAVLSGMAGVISASVLTSDQLSTCYSVSSTSSTSAMFSETLNPNYCTFGSGTYQAFQIVSSSTTLGPIQYLIQTSVGTFTGTTQGPVGHIQASTPQVIIVPGILGTKLYSTDPNCPNFLVGCVFWLSDAMVEKTVTNPFVNVSTFAPFEYDPNGVSGSNLSLGGVLNFDTNPTGFSGDQLDCGLPLGPVISIFNSALGCDRTFFVYDQMAQQLMSHGFAAASASTNIQEMTFPYDWRGDISGIADSLYSRIQALHAQAPNRPIAIVAHSMGGLVVGELLRKYGASLGGILGPVITLGTPYGGSPDAYLNLQGWHQTQPFSKSLTQQIGANWTALYELLPRWSFVHELGAIPSYDTVYRGTADSVNLPGLPRQSAVTIAESLWAHNAMTYSNAYAIVGSGLSTVNGVSTLPQLLANSNSTLPSCLGPAAILGNGDGEVPVFSAVPVGPLLQPSWIPAVNVRYVNELHAGLPTNPDVISAVLQVLSGGGMTTNQNLVTQPFSEASTWESLVCSPVTITVQDAVGNITNDIVEQIPNSLSLRFGTHMQTWFPRGKSYSVALAGTGSGTFNWFLRALDSNGELIARNSFLQVPVTPNSKGSVTIDDSGVTALAYDYAGNGVVDNIPPNTLPPDVSCSKCSLLLGERKAALSFTVGYVGALSTFDFHLGDLGLQSSRVDQVQVFGRTATFSGHAAINGVPGFSFYVTVKKKSHFNHLELRVEIHRRCVREIAGRLFGDLTIERGPSPPASTLGISH